MNQHDIFEHLMKTDSVFRKKVISMAAEYGSKLYNAAMGCAPAVEADQIKQSSIISRPRRNKKKSLTSREEQVRNLTREHQSLKKVCKLMKLNERAVRCHMRNVQDKTGEDLFALVGKKRIYRRFPKCKQDRTVESRQRRTG